MTSKAKHFKNEAAKITSLVLNGSIGVGLVIALLLFGYDILVLSEPYVRSAASMGAILYLLLCLFFFRKKLVRTASWMLIFFYSLIACAALLYWGLNAALGILATSFVIVLSGILLGSSAIMPVALCLTLMLCAVHFLHTLHILAPNPSTPDNASPYFDLISYITILGIFAMVTWLSNGQMERNLERAKAAEAKIRSQKDMLASELENESVQLRQTQLSEMQQLYKFATLGQNAAATLHELSNHLSVLNMDIDDLKQHHRNSNAIKNAEESIEQINTMMRQIKRKINNFDENKHFKIGPILKRIIKDQKERSKVKQVELEFDSNNLANCTIHGDPFALAQIMTVLVHNAFDACTDLPNAKVVVKLTLRKSHLLISVIDNGIGVSDILKSRLFTPTASTKPGGLGIGLYIARQLAESQFKASITLEKPSAPYKMGAHFVVSIPLSSPRNVPINPEKSL